MDDNNEILDSELTNEDVEALGDDLFDGWDDDLISEDAEASEEESKEEEDTAEDEDESESSDQAEEEDEDEAEDDNNPKAEEKPEKEDDKTSQPAKTYNFKHLDDNLTLTADEMVPYVQKGLDYDRIREERDAMKPNYAKYELYAEFLESIKGDFSSIEDLMDDTNAAILVKNEAANGRTLTKEDALKRVKANREEKFKAKVPPKTSDEKPAEEENPMKAEVKSFTATFKKVFPNEKVPAWDELPKEVQSEFESTGQLIAPYMAWRMAQKESEIKTIKNNQKNKERSTGSRKTKGKGMNLDNIFEGFGDDD